MRPGFLGTAKSTGSPDQVSPAQVRKRRSTGLIATEDTEFFQFCRDLPDDPAEEARGRTFYADADLRIMGRAAYQSMASACGARSRGST